MKTAGTSVAASISDAPADATGHRDPLWPIPIVGSSASGTLSAWVAASYFPMKKSATE